MVKLLNEKFLIDFILTEDVLKYLILIFGIEGRSHSGRRSGSFFYNSSWKLTFRGTAWPPRIRSKQRVVFKTVQHMTGLLKYSFIELKVQVEMSCCEECTFIHVYNSWFLLLTINLRYDQEPY